MELIVGISFSSFPLLVALGTQAPVITLHEFGPLPGLIRHWRCNSINLQHD